MDDAIRIFIGTEPKTEIFRIVLEHSIKTRTQAKVEFTPMIGPEWEVPKDLPAGTGFSLRRWLIPSKCNFQGFAIYMDADQLVHGDVAELWNYPTSIPGGGCSAWMTYQVDKFNSKPWPQSSVMLIDCAKADSESMWHPEEMFKYLRQPDATRKRYIDFMHATWMNPRPAAIPTEWNNLNVYVKGKTRLLHYTKEPEQPSYNPKHPLADMWRQELVATIKAGMIPKELFVTALANFGKQEDWRKSNGLHPIYKKYLPLFDKV